MSVVDVNNIKIAYEMHGEGEPLILIHGYSYNKSVWTAQIDSLSKFFKVIVYDLRGSGESSHPEERYTMEDLVEDLRGLMDTLKIQNAHLAGWSLGGMIIQNFILKYPEYGNKLVLIATNAGLSDSSGINMLRDSIIEIYELRRTDPNTAFFKLARFMHSLKFRKKMEKNLTEKLHGLVTPEELITSSVKVQTEPLALKYLAEIVDNHNTLDRLHEIKNNTLILAGTKDSLISLLLMEMIHEKLPNSTLEVFQGAGHMIFLEEAPKFNQIMIEYLNK